ncbi:AraC family transcriptional regulator [Caballeronia calidae]|uniref:AraC family transcriptional regulator n=1 Tax=Caballeronia calidae TaxID=1777139 RepID=A0A158EFX8_9BURK|nr:response regulator transcription factor [Caballeronia calidae]SAL05789.1 AraC family transcriptional regulator [Caballeronia calidae]
MSESPALNGVRGTGEFLWVDLMHNPDASMLSTLRQPYSVRRVRNPHHVAGAIHMHAPPFVCFEVERSDPRILDSLIRVRHEHPELPVLLITDSDSSLMAKWALRLKLWDLLVKPVRDEELDESIAGMVSLGPSWSREQQGTAQGASRLSNMTTSLQRTSAAVSLVRAQFGEHISLENAASACRLSLSQFCRLFRDEHHMSFGVYLMSFRMQRARALLQQKDILVKDVAYAVGFTDLSYFTRSFKRHFDTCPGAYRDLAQELDEAQRCVEGIADRGEVTLDQQMLESPNVTEYEANTLFEKYKKEMVEQRTLSAHD